jgi:hypothetical protein
MSKHRPPPSKAEDREQQFEKLLAAMDASDPFSRYGLEPALEQIEARWLAAQGKKHKKQDRKLVRQYRAAMTKALALANMIGPDFFANEIEEAGWSRLNPDTDDRTLQTLMADHGHERDDVIAVLTAHGLDIDHWLNISGNVYRKRDVRKLVVEPFLQLMAEREIITSRRQLPRKRLFDALFDWLGVAQKSRPSSVNIDAIARELEGNASASESNAKRQTKN